MRLLLATCCALLLAGGVLADDYRQGDLLLKHPHARATPGRNGAVYLTIESAGAGDRLLSASTEAAASASLHESRLEGGIMRMRPLEDGIPIPAGGEVSLAPGGMHIMLLGLTAPLAAGDSFPLTLGFERAGEVVVEVEVEPLAPGDYGRPEHGHGQMHRR